MAYTKTTWIDKAVQFAKRYYMNWDGGNDKNLLPPFSDWTMDVNATIVANYSFTLNASTTSNYLSTIKVTVVPNSVYTVSRANTSGWYAYRFYDASGAVLAGYVFALVNGGTTSAQITSPSNAVQVEFALYNNTTIGTFTFTNPQLELGSSATSFTPKKMYTIVQSGGTVTQAGTPVNAANLNKIEQGVSDAHTGVQDTQILMLMGAL